MKLSIYKKEYWLKKGYTEEDSKKMVEKSKKETSCRCREFWMKRGYTEEESIKIISDKQRETALKQNFTKIKKVTQYEREFWIKKGITRDDEIKLKIEEAKNRSNPYKILNDAELKSMMNKRRETYYSKTEEELKEINKKRGRTKDQLIEEYGHFEANNMVKNRGKNKKFYRRSSKISESFFNKLQDILKDEILFYGRNEKWIRIEKNNGFFVDLLNENKIIEFNGDFFHANPIKYKKDDIIKISENEQYLAKDIWEKDRNKIDKLINLKYEVYVVWENDVVKNCELELIKCVNFLKK